ncbi:MAG: TonB-dependent receptor [Thiomicrorhabdus sp.]|nr:TonB-dependent receptor [Thiomicrorhabdus sp.]
MKLSKLSTAILLATSASFAQAKATQLNNVIVTANHTAMSQHSVTANTTVITAEDIAENHYRTLQDALESIPGIHFVRNGGLGTSTSIFIRGQKTGSTLVLVNGIEMTNPMGTGGAILSNLLLSGVERIEVLKGPQSGIWGSRASAGVINIITKQAQTGTQGSVTLETGDNNYNKLAVSLSSAEKNGDFVVNFSQLKTDGFSAVKEYKSYEQNYEDDAFNQTDFSLNMGININPAHRLEVLLKTANSTINYDFTSNPDQVLFASTEYQNTIKRLQYVYAREQFNSTVFVSQNNVQQYSNDAFINSVGIKGGYQYATDQSLSFALNNNQYLNLSNGDSYYNTGVGITNTNHFNNKKFIITQAFRSDSFNQFKDKTTGKLGIKNYFNDDIYISANVGTAYNAPTLFQLTYNATTNLQPEETTGFDINLGLYDFDISYYQTRAKNFINYNSGSGFPNDFYENLDGTTDFEGIEFAYNNYFEPANMKVNVTYAQVSAKDSNNEFLARRAEQTVGLNLLYDGFNKLTIGLNNRYIGNMFDRANRSGANIGDYYVTDLNLNYTVNKNLTAYLNVVNLFDADYTQAVATYQADNVTPQNVYSNGGSQLFVGLQGKF